MELSLIGGELAVCRLEPGSKVPTWAIGSELVSVTFTAHEVSVICDAAGVPADVTAERGWRALVVTTAMDFSTTGVAAAITVPLAEASISVLPLATHDTDYFLVKDDRLADAIAALLAAGHHVTA
jgi:hypothetical protein